MTSHIVSNEAARQYAAAYAAHYSQRDLPLALRLYQDLLSHHPNVPEATYARMQLHNMFTLTVPQQQRVDQEISLLKKQLTEGTAPSPGLSVEKSTVST